MNRSIFLTIFSVSVVLRVINTKKYYIKACNVQVYQDFKVNKASYCSGFPEIRKRVWDKKVKITSSNGNIAKSSNFFLVYCVLDYSESTVLYKQ